MKNKGSILIETLVSLTIFSLTITVLISGAIFLKKRSYRQYEKLQFINILYDINNYLNTNTDEFNYFEEDYIHYKDNIYYVYYDSSFTLSNNEYYKLSYYYKNNELIITISKGNETIIDNINYGGNRIKWKEKPQYFHMYY